MKSRHCSKHLSKRVLAVGLNEGHVAFGIGVEPDKMRKLLEDQDHADRSEQPADDAHGKIDGDHAGPRDAQSDLNDAGDEDCEQEGFVRAERRDLGGDDGREPGRRTANAGLRTAEKADDEAADDPGDQPGDRRGPGRLRNAQAQRQRNQKDDDARNCVADDCPRETLPGIGNRHQSPQKLRRLSYGHFNAASGYIQRNRFKAMANDTAPHAAMIAMRLICAVSGAPSSITLRRESISGVSGSNLITG